MTRDRSTRRWRPTPNAHSRERGIAPIGAVLLIAITVVLAGGVTATALDAPPEPAPTAMVSLEVVENEITLHHRSGDPIPLTDLSMHVSVDGDPLAKQPPVPYFSVAGFHPGPTGVLNPASDDVWRPGESTSFAVAGTNDPVVTAGVTVEVTVTVRDQPVATLSAQSRPG